MQSIVPDLWFGRLDHAEDKELEVTNKKNKKQKKQNSNLCHAFFLLIDFYSAIRSDADGGIGEQARSYVMLLQVRPHRMSIQLSSSGCRANACRRKRSASLSSHCQQPIHQQFQHPHLQNVSLQSRCSHSDCILLGRRYVSQNQSQQQQQQQQNRSKFRLCFSTRLTYAIDFETAIVFV